MCGPTGVPSTPTQLCASGAGNRSRFRAFAVRARSAPTLPARALPARALPARALSGTAVAGLVLLSAWWLPAGTARAASYPPALGCAVAGTVAVSPAAAGQVATVHGMGFRAGSAVLVSIGGHGTDRTVAESAGSFEAAWPITISSPGSTLQASGPGCSVTGRLTIQDQPGRPEPVPPSEPSITAIPVARLTGLPPQLFLGLAGAVLLAGAALTGLTGRLGHRTEGRSSGATSAAGRLPTLGGPHLRDAPDLP